MRDLLSDLDKFDFPDDPNDPDGLAAANTYGFDDDPSQQIGESNGFQIINPSRLPTAHMQPFNPGNLVAENVSMQEDDFEYSQTNDEWDGCVEMDDGTRVSAEDWIAIQYGAAIASQETMLPKFESLQTSIGKESM